MQIPTTRRRLRARLIGVGLDGSAESRRVVSGSQCLIVGGSPETQADLFEAMLRLESELERRGRDLAECDPDELVEIAWRADVPELHEIATRLREGLERAGRTFADSTPEELTQLAAAPVP